MDQIFLQINRTLRQFTDNLIRSSSDLKDEEKEARGEKTRSTGAVDEFDDGSLANSMSDDFLGELGTGPGGGKKRERKMRKAPVAEPIPATRKWEKRNRKSSRILRISQT
ncbi:MAG: hypothetical protein HYU64_12700 [Armatimonadetes bacterium]|nr:hypothetical protein [Armatimonadota bacterium]